MVTEAGPGGGGGGWGVTLAFMMRYRRSAALHLHYRRAVVQKLSLRASPKRLRQISHGHAGHSLPSPVLLIGK